MRACRTVSRALFLVSIMTAGLAKASGSEVSLQNSLSQKIANNVKDTASAQEWLQNFAQDSRFKAIPQEAIQNPETLAKVCAELKPNGAWTIDRIARGTLKDKSCVTTIANGSEADPKVEVGDIEPTCTYVYQAKCIFKNSADISTAEVDSKAIYIDDCYAHFGPRNALALVSPSFVLRPSTFTTRICTPVLLGP